MYINEIESNDNKKAKKKRIIVIKKIKHRDGSVSKERQTIYKNYGINPALNESQQFNKSLSSYQLDI